MVALPLIKDACRQPSFSRSCHHSHCFDLSRTTPMAHPHAEDNRQAVLTAADDDDFGIGRLSELKRRLDTAPTQVRIRDSLTDDLLEIADTFGLDLLTLRLFSFAHHAKCILL